MLRLPSFRLLRPRSLAEAVRLLAEEGAGEGQPVRLVAGGTDLWPNMKRRNQKAATVISLMGVPELSGIRGGHEDSAGDSGHGTNGSHGARPARHGVSLAGGAGAAAGNPPSSSAALRIGATTLLDTVARDPRIVTRYPALATAVASISSPPLRNMGTLGGNLCLDTRCTYYNQTEEWRRSIDYCMKEEGSICWVATSSPRCWAHSASDAAPMLCALDTSVRLAGSGGARELPLADLYRDDGIDYLTRRPDEILTEIVVPARAAAGRCHTAFWKLRRRGSIDFAVLSVAAAVWTDDAGIVTGARLYLGAVGSWPVAATAAAQLLIGQPLRALTSDAKLLAAAGLAARKVATPMDNTDFQAQWRGVMTARYTEAALRQLAGGEPQLLAPRHPLLQPAAG
jgi:4-hydroxybenzoyl-CoA reductase subunit beta